MKAIVLEKFGGPEVLTIREVDTPKAGPDDVVIRVETTAVNRADLLERQGHYPPPDPKPQHQIPGLECAGVVVDRGDRVTRFRIGDKVLALLPGGGYAEYVTCPEDLAWKKPETLTWVQAGAIPEVFLTAFDALWDKAGLMPGERVLIHAAAGGVGSAAVQLAARAGLQVAATTGSAKKVSFIRNLGANLVVNYHEQDFVEEIKEWSRGRGVDAVIDFVGQDYLSKNLQSLATGGTLVVVGTLSGSSAPLDLRQVLGRRLTIRGTALRSRPRPDKMRLVQTFAERTTDDFITGQLKPIIDRVLPLDQIGEAHRILASNQTLGKVVIAVKEQGSDEAPRVNP